MPKRNTVSTNSVRARREALGLTRQQLAGLAACSMSFIQVVEGGWSAGGESKTLLRVLAALERAEKEAAA